MRRFLAGILAVQLAFPVWAAAQQPPATQPPPTTQQPSGPQPAAPPQPVSQGAMLSGTLKILILEGQNAINSTERGMAAAPVVEVRNQDDRPVEGASVTFRLPPSGASGLFPGQQLSKTVLTNVQGQAIGSGLVPNQQNGRFRIHVTATASNRMGETDIVQTNTPREFVVAQEPVKKKKWKKWALIGGAGVGVVVAVILLTRKGSTPASSLPSVTINAGPPVIGGR